MVAVTSLSPSSIEQTKFGKKNAEAVISQFFGFFLDSYDLTLILSIAPVIAVVFFPKAISPLEGALLVFLSYALTLLFRPLGSAIFGNLGDKIGRRNVLIITILGLGASSGLTAVLPTFATVGIAAIILFSFLRILVGIFAGGEYAAGHPFAMEWTPKNLRGTVSGIIQGGFPFGAALAAAVEGLFLAHYGLSALENYGWRYLFLTSIVVALVALFVRISIKDTPIFTNLKKNNKIRKQPFYDVFRNKVTRTYFFIAMIWMTGLTFTGYAFLAYVTIVLEHAPSVWIGNNIGGAISIYTYASFAAFAGIVTFGTLSQRYGRRRTSLVWVIFGIVLPIPLFYGLIHFASIGNFGGALMIAIFIGFSVMMPTGITLAFLSEMFPTSVRASGVGFGFSSGFFFGAWFGPYIGFLHSFFSPIETATNVWLSVAVITMIGAMLIGIAMYFAPETSGTSLLET